MITNLVFKRTANVEGSSRTEMKIIEVMLPELKSNEGWMLVSSADHVEVSEIPRCKSVAQIEEEEAVKKFTEDYRVTKAKQQIEESLKAQDRYSRVLADAEKPDPSITAYNSCADTEDRYINKVEDDTKFAEAAANLENFKETAADSIDVTVRTPKKPIEYPSPIDGTACLIRRNDTIRIAYREGKKSNINTPNKICISDFDKQHFFNAVRAANGGSDIITSWSLDKNSHYYDTWNRFIDDEYISQREEHLRRTGKR